VPLFQNHDHQETLFNCQLSKAWEEESEVRETRPPDEDDIYEQEQMEKFMWQLMDERRERRRQKNVTSAKRQRMDLILILVVTYLFFSAEFNHYLLSLHFSVLFDRLNQFESKGRRARCALTQLCHEPHFEILLDNHWTKRSRPLTASSHQGFYSDRFCSA
jgi:hypothetical protein